MSVQGNNQTSISQSGPILTTTDTNGDTVWSTITFKFTAISPTSTIVFSDKTGGDGALTDGWITNVRVQSAALTITDQPQSQVVYWRGSASFSVSTLAGTPPYTYQWLKDGQSIAGATSLQLNLADIQDTDSGAYTATVTDADNTIVTSRAAILTVNPAGVTIATYVGLTINGIVGQTYGIQASTDLNNPSSWSGVANVTLAAPSQVWVDYQSASTQPKRFYRVAEGVVSIP